MFCSLEDCNSRVHAKGLCNLHYRRFRKTGSYSLDKPREYGFDNTRHPLYPTWIGMRQRCQNPKSEQYKHYGARGISVCERWDNSFQMFVSDMGEKPEGSTLDRVDNSGDYTPENCRWATHTEQALNRRVRSTNKTKITGISFNKNLGKYVVRRHNKATGKREYLGCADTLDQAKELLNKPKSELPAKSNTGIKYIHRQKTGLYVVKVGHNHLGSSRDISVAKRLLKDYLKQSPSVA